MPLEPKHLNRLKKSLNRLKLSVAVKGILVDIANELHDIYDDAIKELQKENATLKKKLAKK